MWKEHYFFNDAEYLEAEYDYLRLLASRINAEREAIEAGDAEERGETPRNQRTKRETTLTAAALQLAEDEARQLIDGRLAAHRAADDRPRLGVDALCLEHDLSRDERLVLIAASVGGFGAFMSERVFSSLSFYGSPSVENLCSLLDPKTTGDWLAVKRFFRDDAPLIRSGLVQLAEARGEEAPDTLLTREARLSMSAWATVTGDAA